MRFFEFFAVIYTSASLDPLPFFPLPPSPFLSSRLFSSHVHRGSGGTGTYQGPGSHGYEAADVDWMVAAGADYLKVRWYDAAMPIVHDAYILSLAQLISSSWSSSHYLLPLHYDVCRSTLAAALRTTPPRFQTMPSSAMP
jgi:hypothetical protein